MTEAEIFSRFFNGGKYSLPYLIEFSHPDLDTIRLVNALEDVTFNGETYNKSTFSYTEPDYLGDGGSLEITLADNDLIEFLESADWQMQIKVVGVINEDGTITQIKIYNHAFCTCSWTSDMKLSLQLNHDDRMSMAFPPYIFDSDNNRGGV